jgi:predicted nucleic acid-binding protein
MLLLDTSAVSAVMHRSAEALARLREETPADVVLCSPVGAEIEYGLARLAAGSRRRRLLQGEYRRLREAVRWSDWTEDAAVEFGRLKASLELAGKRLDDMDLIVASVALSLGARVATLNARHFARAPGLTVADWTVR